jgi:hypothetical protein
MASDRSNDLTITVDRILRERLEQFGVPSEVRNELRSELLAFFQRPEKQPFGACIMTPAASIAADQARKAKETQKSGSKPEII